MSDNRRERDLILAPNEYAYILDETKGNIVNYVGPHKTSLANTDQPVFFSFKTKMFQPCSLDQAKKTFSIAPEGWYLVLKNPAEGGKLAKIGTANTLPELMVGKKINIPGPVAFTPWPGQMVRVIPGHHLRSNQYLLVRVYDEEAARENWKKAVIKPQTNVVDQKTENDQESIDKAPQEIQIDPKTLKPDSEIDLTMGKQLVIKGTEVSFYIPPTGIEVVADQNINYIRNAVTLERLEYCILLDEDGNKRYIKGPAVVFPKPTETFISKNGFRKFKAIELNEISGIYVKVIAPYSEDGKDYKVGDELFITGKDQMIYFPRPEHAIVKYGEKEIIYAVAIPAGEARYVLNRLTGQITLKKGPSMFLPDPRKEVIVRRIVDLKHISLWFPGNSEALEYNKKMQDIAAESEDESFGFLAEDKLSEAIMMKSAPASKKFKKEARRERAIDDYVGDQFDRGSDYSPPRTITLNTKYDGAVAISAWTGYAFLVVSKTGTREVVVGPKTYLLEYDQFLEPIELSTGTPKNDDNLLKTVYLRTLHNKVSDTVSVETKDLCQVDIELSYRVNFEGDPELWFNVENYVKFLTDHMRSLLRGAIKQYGIEEFYSNAITIIRDSVLGKTQEDGKRVGRRFSENGMRIYDVEVLEIVIEEDEIESLLVETNHDTITRALELTSAKDNLLVTKEQEDIKQQIAKLKAETFALEMELKEEQVKKEIALELTKIEKKISMERRSLEAELEKQSNLKEINQSEIDREKVKSDYELSIDKERLNQWVEELKAEVDAVVNKAKAISPQLISALQNFSDKELAQKVADSMAPLAILGGKSVAEVFGNLIKGTILEKVLTKEEK